MCTSESRRKPQDLKVEGKLFTGVSSLKYLGNMINNGNRNDNCVKESVQAEHMAYFTNLSTLKSKIISRAAKIQVYKTLIRPVAIIVVTYKITNYNIFLVSFREIYSLFSIYISCLGKLFFRNQICNYDDLLFNRAQNT
jgi:hypothetical protein